MGEIVRISKETVAVLQNFAGINQSIYIKPGEHINTISNGNNILAKAKITEEFPKAFAIYDLGEFLGTLDLFENPILDFNKNDSYVRIAGKDGKHKVNYYFADPEVVHKMEKEIVMPETEVAFILGKDNLAKLLKAASVLQLNDLTITNDGENIAVNITDNENTTSNNYAITVEPSLMPEVPFNFVVKVEALKMMVNEYDIGISSRKLAHFLGPNIEYWIALNEVSTYGD